MIVTVSMPEPSKAYSITIAFLSDPAVMFLFSLALARFTLDFNISATSIYLCITGSPLYDLFVLSLKYFLFL